MTEEIMLTIILWRMLWFVVSKGITILQFGPRPKTIPQTSNDRLDKRLVRVVCEKFIEFFNIDITSDFEKVRVLMDCFVGSKVFEF